MTSNPAKYSRPKLVGGNRSRIMGKSATKLWEDVWVVVVVVVVADPGAVVSVVVEAAVAVDAVPASMAAAAAFWEPCWSTSRRDTA